MNDDLDYAYSVALVASEGATSGILLRIFNHTTTAYVRIPHKSGFEWKGDVTHFLGNYYTSSVTYQTATPPIVEGKVVELEIDGIETLTVTITDNMNVPLDNEEDVPLTVLYIE